MPGHDLIVLGASAGGLEAVSEVVAGLPADLSAAVCVVIHLRPDTPSRLTEILSRITRLQVVAARNGMVLQPGVVHVGVPDLHVLVERGDDDRPTLRLVRGPRENRARPAVDPLFRSAALAYGPRVIGVVLSGALDDGTAGLWTVKDRGGIAVVQEPADAVVSSMPANALNEVAVDHVAPATELGSLLGRLARKPVPASAHVVEGVQPTDELAREIGITVIDEIRHIDSERYGRPARFTCPDCGGVLWKLGDRGPLRFRCEVGHAHSAASLAETQTEAAEAAMWAALRALEDRIELARWRAAGAAARGDHAQAAQYTAEEQASQQHAAAIRALLRLDGRAGIRPREQPEAPVGRSPQEAGRAEPGSGAVGEDVDDAASYSASGPHTQ